MADSGAKTMSGVAIPAKNAATNCPRLQNMSWLAMKRPEQALQRACVEYLTLLENQGKLRFFHVPNGGARSRTEGAIFKALGVRAGVPDLVILPAYGDACFVELKAGKGRLTRTQEDWGEWLAQHYRHRICRSLDDLRAALKVWGTM